MIIEKITFGNLTSGLYRDFIIYPQINFYRKYQTKIRIIITQIFYMKNFFITKKTTDNRK